MKLFREVLDAGWILGERIRWKIAHDDTARGTGQAGCGSYLPADLYAKANRDREADLAQLSSLKGDRAAVNNLKKEIAVAIAAVLTTDDFDSIPTIVEAAQRAIAEAT